MFFYKKIPGGLFAVLFFAYNQLSGNGCIRCF